MANLPRSWRFSRIALLHSLRIRAHLQLRRSVGAYSIQEISGGTIRQNLSCLPFGAPSATSFLENSDSASLAGSALHGPILDGDAFRAARRMELSCLDTLCRMVLLPLFPSASLGSCQSKEQNDGPMADMPAHPRSWWTTDFDWRKGVLAINSCSYAFAATSGILPGDVTGSVFPESFLFRLLSRDRHRFVGHTFAGS